LEYAVRREEIRMEVFEELVMWHLTCNHRVFVCPQYQILGEHGLWSMPDFVALDFEQRKVSVVEVSAASWPGGLLRKVLDRQTQWIEKLRNQLRQSGVADDSWDFQVILYIRRSAEGRFRQYVGDARDVIINTIEEVGFPWEWDWPSAKAEKEKGETEA
jgi:hypothetical protein